MSDTCRWCVHFAEDDHPSKINHWGNIYTDYDESYCKKHRKYVSKYYGACSYYEERVSGCFLTSACVEYKGMPDDCELLTKLRHFRDTYLRASEDGKALVQEYYAIAPSIVTKIDARADKADIYDYIYSVIVQCVAAIDANKNENAVSLYYAMVKRVAQTVNT